MRLPENYDHALFFIYLHMLRRQIMLTIYVNDMFNKSLILVCLMLLFVFNSDVRHIMLDFMIGVNINIDKTLMVNLTKPFD